MDNLDLLSDDELRLRLVQYGFQNLPVTATTRKVLVKKLRNYMSSEQSKLRRETSYATRYSSDEDFSDRENRVKRKTIAAFSQANSNSHISMPPPQKVPSPAFFVSPSSSNNMDIKSYKRSTMGEGGINTSSSSNNVLNALPYLSSHNKIPVQSRSSVYIPPPIISHETDEDESDDYQLYADTKNKSSSSSNNSRISSPSRLAPIKNFMSTASADVKRSPRNFSPASATNGYSNHNFNTPSSPSTKVANNNSSPTPSSPSTPYFTQRLLNLRRDTMRGEKRKTAPLTNRVYMGGDPSAREGFSGFAGMSEPPPSTRRGRTSAISSLLTRFNDQYGFRQSVIPCLLVSGLIAFFALVSFVYLSISPNLAKTLNPKDTIYKPCNIGFIEHGFCISDESQLTSALELLKVVAPELQRRVEVNRCTDVSASFLMSARDVLHHAVDRDNSRNVLSKLDDLHNMEYLIAMNPQWRINNVNANGLTIDLHEVNEMRASKSNYFAILNPKLPFSCSIYKKLQTFSLIVGWVSLIALIMFVGRFLVRTIINQRQSRKDRINLMVNEIINVLMEKAANSMELEHPSPSSSLVVVNHLRDKIIPPSERTNSEWVWKAAIQTLEQNESRVQFEMGTCNGEDVKMMRWIDTVAPHFNARSSQVKKWQSPAFDKSNKIKDPPTPCLKIRQMFEKYEANQPNLKQVIQDAILEKVGTDCNIFDIQLDSSTCCVYVRCATQRDAGIVHDEINGWWFDNRLVSIKFIQLERYLSRFPKAPNGPACLRPSNTNNLSMSQCKDGGKDINRYDDDDEDDDNDNEEQSYAAPHTTSGPKQNHYKRY